MLSAITNTRQDWTTVPKCGASCTVINRTLEWLFVILIFISLFFCFDWRLKNSPTLKKKKKKKNHLTLDRSRRRDSSNSFSCCNTGSFVELLCVLTLKRERFAHNIAQFRRSQAKVARLNLSVLVGARVFDRAPLLWASFVLRHILVTSSHVSIKVSPTGGRRTREGESTRDQRRPQWLVPQFKSVRMSLNIPEGSTLEKEKRIISLACMSSCRRDH